jgi:L-lactate dehydrogenase complex protein LldG
MNSRERILNAIKMAKQQEAALPQIPQFLHKENNLETFIEVATGIGSVCTVLSTLQPLIEFYNSIKERGEVIINGIEALDINDLPTYCQSTAGDLESVSYLFLPGSISVAENGAVWLSDEIIGNRMLPFIAANLVLLLEEKNIVPTMHYAYEQIKIDMEGYGVFIAGPSKTADIEQSLVIGAHGPISHHIFIVAENKL